MRRVSFFVLVALGLGLSLGVVPAMAQSITGISLRPREAAPAGSAKGWADIVEANGGYKVSIDLSSNAERLQLDDYDNAEAFVVWAVDMEGVPHNIGVLADDLKLADAPVDFVVAKLIVTAEASADATVVGEPLFEATLRQVVMKAEAAAGGAATTAQQATAKPEATAEATASPTAEPQAKPSELPTTGSVAQDLLVLAMLASALLAVGLRLRTAHF